MYPFFPFDNDVIEQFVEKEFADQLTSYGLKRYRGCGRRWHKVENEIIFSLQFVRNYSNAEVYYGFQPLFFPFEFTDVRIQLHNMRRCFFNASADSNRSTGEKSFYLELHPEYYHQNVAFFNEYLECSAYLAFQTVHDLKSCHKLYKQKTQFRGGWDPRMVFECLAIGDKNEISDYLENLSPMLSRFSNTIPVSDGINAIWMDKKVVEENLRSGDYSMFFSMMDSARSKNIQRLKRAGYL